MGSMLNCARRELTKKPERYETVRAFGLSIYVASLSSVSRYPSSSYPTTVKSLSIVSEFEKSPRAKHAKLAKAPPSHFFNFTLASFALFAGDIILAPPDCLTAKGC